MTVDYADYQTPQAHASSIAATGVPLLTLSTNVVNDVARAVPFGGAKQTVVTNAPVTQIGYEVNITALIAAGAATIPTLTVDLIWNDSVTNTIVGHETWTMVMGTASGGSQHIGTGPTKGNRLTITVSNNDSAANATVTTVINQNSRVYGRDDWRTEGFNTVPNVTVTAHNQQGNTLIQFLSAALGIGASAKRLLGLYAGKVTVVAFSTTSQLATLQVTSLDPNFSASSEYILLALPAANTATPVTLALPRAPCTITVTNTSGGAGNIVQANIVIDEHLP